MPDTVFPPLPSGSVDFGQLHEAAMKGEVTQADVDKATTRPQPREAERVATIPTPDFRYEAKAGGWHEITGPGLNEPFRTQDRAKAAKKWDEVTGEALPEFTALADVPPPSGDDA